jgi:hypothetical protein
LGWRVVSSSGVIFGSTWYRYSRWRGEIVLRGLEWVDSRGNIGCHWVV